MKRAIYLDHAAATPLDDDVKKAMEPYFSHNFFNPSAIYQGAVQVSEAVNQARKSVAQILGARANEITFTSGATESNNLAIQGVAREFPEAHFVTTALEHDSVLRPLAYLQNGCSVSEVKPKPNGIVAPQMILKAVTDKTVLVSVMYANNEVGTIQPLKEIAAGLKAIRDKRQQAGNILPLYFHTDAAQAGNYLDLSVHRLGVDLMSLNGGKIYGPKQSGVLFVASHVKLQPLILGGGQEHGLRSGTENVPGIIGFAKALQITQHKKASETSRLQAIQDSTIERLKKANPSILINGSIKHRLPNNIHLTIPGYDNERLLFALDDLGLQVAAGSACSASSEEASHVLLAMGLSEVEARSSLRITMGRSTTEKDMQIFVEKLHSIL